MKISQQLQSLNSFAQPLVKPVWRSHDSETLRELEARTVSFSFDASSLLAKQREMAPVTRSIVLDWMVEVAANCYFKRETLHLATCYFDKYLSVTEAVPRTQLQLVGATALLLAAKFEEVVTPSVEELLKATAYTYESWEVCAMEKDFVRVLQWRMLPATLNQWVNYIFVEWDKFAKEVMLESGFLFREPRESSYKMYRSAMHIQDVALLDIHHHTCPYSHLALAILRSILSRFHNAKQQRWSSAFSHFCAEVLGLMSLETLRTSFAYVDSFTLPEEFGLPKVRSRHFEEFLNLQTYSPETLRSIRLKYSL
mmetsp:Transcript_10263/g.20021  ORF Transcript_10263/g.20021 Transcript_10263/m.20021 type:complete len:311 (+) Transcript_10263:53-985(+)